MTNSQQQDEVRQWFQDKLNQHGYAFQYAAIRRGQEAFESKQERGSRWIFEASEVPVRTRERHTKIDFVLSRTTGPVSWYAICECKRVNPARSNWCFIRSPFVHRDHAQPGVLLFDSVDIPIMGEPRTYSRKGVPMETYAVGLAVRSHDKGDAQGRPDDDAIEEAASQVLLGVNGFVTTLITRKSIVSAPEGRAVAFLLPVIITTARLWVSEANLSETDVRTGYTDISNADFRETPWLWHEHYTSPGLKHQFDDPPAKTPTSISTLMTLEYIRHIAIVNADGIADFLAWSSDADLILT